MTGDPKTPEKTANDESSKKPEIPETPPIVTQHQIALNGETLSYTATTGQRCGHGAHLLHGLHP